MNLSTLLHRRQPQPVANPAIFHRAHEPLRCFHLVGCDEKLVFVPFIDARQNRRLCLDLSSVGPGSYTDTLVAQAHAISPPMTSRHLDKGDLLWKRDFAHEPISSPLPRAMINLAREAEIDENQHICLQLSYLSGSYFQCAPYPLRADKLPQVWSLGITE